MIVESLRLPWPPSINHYWIRQPKGFRISPEGIAFRKIVAIRYRPHGKFLGPVGVTVSLCQPSKHRRDLDNLAKPLLDALTHAGAWEDDSQVHDLRLFWESRHPMAGAYVTIQDIPSVRNGN
jgi:crossover junction endodeoxyribonuclease RusA